MQGPAWVSASVLKWPVGLSALLSCHRPDPVLPFVSMSRAGFHYAPPCFQSHSPLPWLLYLLTRFILTQALTLWPSQLRNSRSSCLSLFGAPGCEADLLLLVTDTLRMPRPEQRDLSCFLMGLYSLKPPTAPGPLGLSFPAPVPPAPCSARGGRQGRCGAVARGRGR